MKKIVPRILILLVIVSIPIYLIYKDSASKNTSTVVVIPVATTTKPSSTSVGIIIDQSKKGKNISVEGIDIQPQQDPKMANLSMPDINKKWIMSPDFPSDAKRIVENNSVAIIDSIKNNPDQYDKWINLGTLRKTIGDYVEAKNMWEYASKKWPGSIVAHHNLGDLYAGYLKDQINAEKNFLKVIELDPKYIVDYISLYNLYRIQYGETADKTVATLLSGLKNNNGSIDLMMTLGSHYKSVNDKENAKKYYEMVLKEAEQIKNTELQNMVQLELNNL